MSYSALHIDAAAEADRIEKAIREIVFNRLKRKGVVVAVSGGIDSSVVLALCARAVGRDRVLALLMPERESTPDSLRLGRQCADRFGVQSAVEDLTDVLVSLRCYDRRDRAIRTLIPEYGERYECKLVTSSNAPGSYAIFSLVVRSPSGHVQRVRLTADICLRIIAATNFKQRTRKMFEYYYADERQFAVAGTPNILEYDQGFFVKQGDGAADFKPIAHLYKSQVYELGEFLGVPEEIQSRPATTDTYPLEQTQEEFYFSLPLAVLDLCLFGKDNAMRIEDIAASLGLDEKDVERIYQQIEARRRVAEYLHMPALLIERPDTSHAAAI